MNKFDSFSMEKNCPACGHHFIDQKPDWLGLPAGVKFDPTDPELIEHLEAKVEGEEDMKLKSHPLINEFIPTIEGDDGICYTHPEKLPGVTRDGLSRHFFHRPSKAYTTGTRKRRKIQTECCDLAGGGETRWHKTGKTRAVMANGRQKGCKKILVLYTNFGKNRKPEKTNWVMHQYHMGTHEEEREGELVVSKIFYQTQPRQCTISDRTTTAAAAGSSLEMMKSDHFGYVPDSFDKAGVGEASSVGMDGGGFISQSGEDHAISTIICSTHLHHQHSSMIVGHHQHHHHHHQDSYHLPTMMIPPDHDFQEHHHHKVGEMSGAGLEELVMSCSTDIKEEERVPNQEDAEWLKYSFWPDPHTSDHHHHHHRT